MTNCLGFFILTLLFCLSPLHSGATDNPNRPDILILVYALSNGQGQVSMTYPGIVPHTQAQRDLKSLGMETGWHISDTKITDLPPPIQNAKGKMTGIEFTATGALVPDSNTLTVEPIIHALRAYRQIGLTYFVESGFGFQGLRSYSDNHVRIAMTQRGSTYSYQILVRDPHFGKLNLPRYQPITGDSRVVDAAGHSAKGTRPWMVVLVVLTAIGAGSLVYAVLARQV